MSLALDVITVLLAIHALYLYSKRLAWPWNNPETWVAISIIITYLVAQSGWSTSYLTGNLWGALYNNYIWFIFNTLVMIYLTMRADK